MVTGKIQFPPSFVEVKSFSERLNKLSLTGDRTKPVSWRLSHARTAAILTADAAVDASHEASVRRAYVTLGLKEVARIATLPFPATVKKAAEAQQLTPSVKDSHDGNTDAQRQELHRGPKISLVGSRLEPLPP